MSKETRISHPVERAAKEVGGMASLASKLGIRRQTVYAWVKRNSIPPERCIQIVEATGGAVSLHELRPDLW